jgi:hypothetical protein
MISQITENRKNLNLQNKWFYVPVDLFHMKVFCYVGNLMEMGLSVKQGLEEFKLPDYEEIVKYVRNHVEANLHEDDGSNDGDAFGDKGIAFIRVNKMDVGDLNDMLLLTHESLHVAKGIMDYVGIEEGDNIECLCYTQEYILRNLISKMSEVGGTIRSIE